MDDRHSNPVRWRLHLYILSRSKSVTNRAHRRAFTCASFVVMKPARNAIDVGLLVGDIEASLAFYVGVLGLPKVQEMQVSFGTLHRLAFGESFVKLIDPSSMPPRGEPGLLAAAQVCNSTCQRQSSCQALRSQWFAIRTATSWSSYSGDERARKAELMIYSVFLIRQASGNLAVETRCIGRT